MARQPASPSSVDDGPALAIRALARAELDAAAALLAEGMRDNPLHVKVFGGDVPRRRHRLLRFLRQLLDHVHANGALLGAYVDQELIGVLGMMKPGRCRPAPREALRMAGAIIASNPPFGVLRIHRWLKTWARNDLHEPHAHVGPLAVSPAWRRQGVGRELMDRCCQDLDAQGQTAWLETDLAINVAFYETLGFVVVRQEVVLGVLNWFMRRVPGMRAVVAPGRDTAGKARPATP
jgi:ribosomal protein S18 acetylase RimI-like enzyme